MSGLSQRSRRVGEIELAWKCKNPAGGTVYQIWRRIGVDGELTYMGALGKRQVPWMPPLPAGSAEVMYQIQAMRAAKVGNVAQFFVKFGVSGASRINTAMEARKAA